MTTPRSNDKNTRVRRGLNTLREMTDERLPVGSVCRCARRVPDSGSRDSSNRRLTRNSNALSDIELRSNTSLVSRIPDGDTRTRVATSAISSGESSPGSVVETTLCAYALSSQMKWTFPATVANCTCLNGAVVNMDWHSDSSSWRGSFEGCIGNVFCTMQDIAGAATVGISGIDYATAISMREGVPHSCGAFNAAGTISSDEETVCGIVPPGSIPVDITER